MQCGLVDRIGKIVLEREGYFPRVLVPESGRGGTVMFGDVVADTVVVIIESFYSVLGLLRGDKQQQGSACVHVGFLAKISCGRNKIKTGKLSNKRLYIFETKTSSLC